LLRGVESAAPVSFPPLGGMLQETDVLPPGASEPLRVNANIVSPDYFRTLGLPLEHGRDFQTNANIESAPPVAMVNEVMARLFWPGQDPIGKLLHLADSRHCPPLEVVGVARDGRMQGFRRRHASVLLPAARTELRLPEMTLIGADARGSDLALAEIRRELRALTKTCRSPAPKPCTRTWTAPSRRNA